MDCGEIAVIAGITVVSTGICILCPPATPWVIAGGVAAGALAEGGMEVYKESKTGEYDWVKILTKMLGGGLKGALAASPLKPLATGLGVATTGAIEDYIYCIANGETHEQALKSAAINGPIEGLTVGGCKWLGNALANKVKVSTLTKGPDANIVRDNSAHNAALFEKLRSDYAAKEVREAERIGSALKDDALHRAASFIPEEQLANGKVTSFLGADRKSYTLLQVNGNLNSSNGIYEYIINSSGEITHQRFIIGGKITGFPNQIVPKGGYN